MSYLGDTLTVGLILVLLFGSIALYLYTRIQQNEQKVSLLESIVLDLKLTGELPAFGEFPSLASPSLSSLSSPASLASPSVSSSFASHSQAPSSSKAEQEQEQEQEPHGYKPFLEEEDLDVLLLQEQKEPAQQQSTQEDGLSEEHLPLEETIALHPLPEESPYDSMSLKELQNVVRSRSIPSEKGAKKQALIDLLKRHDHANANEVKPGSTRSSTLLETSSPLSEDVE
jgi:hypothetical protein